MIFKIILDSKYCFRFKLLNGLTLIFFVLYLVGCTTTKIYRVETENIAYKSNYEIINVIMKNGTVINLKGKSPRYAREYKDKKNVIIYTGNDSFPISKDSLNTISNTKMIELDQAKWVTIEKTETDVEKTILLVVAIITVIALIIIIANSSKSDDKDKDSEPVLYDSPCYCPENTNDAPIIITEADRTLNIPRSPLPYNNAKNVMTPVTLSWLCDYLEQDENLRFDIYVDLKNPPTIKLGNNVVNNRFELGFVPPKTTIYWQVVVKNDKNKFMEGPVWSFTTND